ncbi:fasciculation and elongation protein zeta-2 isoform X2 [Thrips palmi]|uniref:Fasciculation and elongation protein zeta-2 isoform X2 n=1 Tax=Thrips palmi TaxID=161013 RepID=A0A6P8YMZ6_THRPL|nr:fasciculation and elongation protein zeta-2 isoform X2 [Thrips palmi]
MRDSGGDKMAVGELKFEAPLAQFEEAEDWGSVDFSKTGGHGVAQDLQDDVRNSNSPLHTNNHNNHHNMNGMHASPDHHNQRNNAHVQCDDNVQLVDNLQLDNAAVLKANAAVAANAANATTKLNGVHGGDAGEDNFLAETFSGSLEDLVNTFDDKITKCFCNYDESVEKLAPVQVRTQEEIMNECQYFRMWWTITGNFGNILPIDWSKSCARKLHMPALNLNECKDSTQDDGEADLSSEDEAVASDLDMHSLILSGLHADAEPVKTAEEVIREIDDMMQDTPSHELSHGSEESLLDENERKGKEVLMSPLYEEKLKTLSVSQLNELYLELEVLIRDFSETLIHELALRDELEEEKELKNSFISLLLAVQNRRRQHHVDKKRNSRNNGVGRLPSSAESKYLTTVIPYHMGGGPPTGQALQFLIKILKAINEDSPTVPALLTDYILKVLCPT